MNAPVDELFFEKMRRLERENLEFCRLIGEKDTEIAGLREALGEIMVECDQAYQCGNMKRVRARAERALMDWVRKNEIC